MAPVFPNARPLMPLSAHGRKLPPRWNVEWTQNGSCVGDVASVDGYMTIPQWPQQPSRDPQRRLQDRRRLASHTVTKLVCTHRRPTTRECHRRSRA